MASDPAGQGLRIVFQDVTYHVKSNQRGRQGIVCILKAVSAIAQPRQMTALMGPSGSGKTTLLDVLAGRKTTGTTTGVILFGNTTPSPAFLRRYTGYVEQFDTLIGSLTVAEMLMYTAELKRSMSEPHSSKVQAVDNLMERLGLTSCAHVKIGDPLTKGISGGQAKRTNIGIALISDPKVLFLDEPTSGLDSYSANEVISLVQGLSRDGTTVVATIHQPSAQAFAMFDQVLMLVKGRTAYFGPLGDACFEFAQHHWPGGHRSYPNCSLAEFLTQVITEAERNGEADAVADSYHNSELRKENDQRVASYIPTTTCSKHEQQQFWGRGMARLRGLCRASRKQVAAIPQASLALDTEVSGSRSSTEPEIKVAVWDGGASPAAADDTAPDSTLHYAATVTPWWWGVWILFKYRTLVNYRSVAWWAPRMAEKIVFAFLFITLYFRSGDSMTQRNMVNMSASMHMWVALTALGAVACIPGIVLERPLFYRERADGLYYVGTYYLVKVVEEFLLVLLVSVPITASVFYGVHYQGSYVLFWLVYLMVLYISTALAYMVAALSPSMDFAMAAMPTYISSLIFCAGQIATLDSIPVYWRWYSVVNFIRWGWNALMINHFGNVEILFSADGFNVLEFFSLGGNKWATFGYLFAFFAVFFVGGYLAMAYVRYSKR